MTDYAFKDTDFNDHQVYNDLAILLDEFAHAFADSYISTVDPNGVLDARIKAVYATRLREMARYTRRIRDTVVKTEKNYTRGANFILVKKEN